MTTLADIGRDAFVYGFPTVDLYRVLHRFALDPESPEYQGPLNEFHHRRTPAVQDERTAGLPSGETVSSYAWLDLRGGPVSLQLPEVGGARHLSGQVIDTYSYVVGEVSVPSGASSADEIVVVGPDQADDVRESVLRCPTQLCLVQLHTEVRGDDDLSAAHVAQDAMSVRPWTSADLHPLTPAPPPIDARHAPTIEFFTVLNWMLYLMPVLEGEESLRAELAAVGIGGVGLRAVLEDSAADLELLQGLQAGLQAVRAHTDTVRSSSGLGTRASLGDDYLTRAAVAYRGLSRPKWG